MTDARPSQQIERPEWSLLLLSVGIALILGAVVGAGLGNDPTERAGGESPAVSCLTYTTETGNASGMCFVSGDVEFEWLDNSSGSGEIRFYDVPANNSTVRRET